jgi:hypothetical protein
MLRFTFFFLLFAISLLGCRKSTDNKVTAAVFESKFKQASRNIHLLMENKRALQGSQKDALSIVQSASLVTDDEASGYVQPLLEPSADFLKSYYDINIYEFFPAGSPNIAKLGAIALRFKQIEEQGKVVDTSQIDGWFDTPVLVSQANGELLTNMAQVGVADCALDALGIPAGLLVGSAKSLSRAALLKAAKKLLSRTVGWIGVAIAIYEFGDCMDWW